MYIEGNMVFGVDAVMGIIPVKEKAPNWALSSRASGVRHELSALPTKFPTFHPDI
jgi:hypothetical protein